MKPFFVDALKVVNLTDLYLTREEFGKQMRRQVSRFEKLNLSIFLLSFGMVMLGCMIFDDRTRLDKLEETRKTNETAG